MAEAWKRKTWPFAGSPMRQASYQPWTDLEEITTLGFRGEALSSLAACARLEITASTGREAHRLSVHGGKVLEQGLSGRFPGNDSVRQRVVF